jgi:anti-repressor protein
MNNEMVVINETEIMDKTFRVYGTFENPLFLAKDVAEWIEHSNLTVMINSVDDDEKLISRTKDCLGRDNSATFLTENGLYEVLMLSRKPIAKQFKTEVKKILKELRLKNSRVPQTFAQALRLAAEQQEMIEAQQVLIEAQKPKVEFYDCVTGSDDTIDMAEVAKVLNCGMGRNRIFQLLREKEILNNSNQPYQQFVDRGYFRVVESRFTLPDGTTRINLKTVVFQKGLDFIRSVVTGNKSVSRKRV